MESVQNNKHGFFFLSGRYDIENLCGILTKYGVLIDTNILPTIADTLATTADLIITCLTYNRYLQVRGEQTNLYMTCFVWLISLL